MKQLSRRLKYSFLASASLLLLGFYPSNSVAAAAKTDTSANKSSSTPVTGPQKPTGADSNTYTYNPATGMWENDHFSWDPATQQTAPKDSLKYSYNPATGMWDETSWRYDAPSGSYQPNTLSRQDNPDAFASSPSSKANNGAGGSSNSIRTNNSTDSTFALFNNPSISNRLNQTSLSGDTAVDGNTLAGNAASGDALIISNLFNLIQSSANFLGPTPATTFTSDIFGDVVGDISIDPSQLRGVSTVTSDANSKLQVAAQNNGQINNNLNLKAASGNANVNGNTTAGNAASGSADAVANVVNMINSVIGAGQSFVGNVNIHGNLNGDILMPQDALNNLLASNVPRATIDTSLINNASTLANLNNTQTINNRLTTAAVSGNTDVSGNTAAGNAASGNSKTNLTVLNLTGHQVIGGDALLVFVNVLGTWTGMIINAPAGTTAAALGGNITVNSTSNTDTSFNASSNSAINNKINVASQSGDASVTNNTEAGNASSGNSTASANIVNMMNSQLDLSNWFGIVFINVFGNWLGSFGVNTSAGNPVASSPSNDGIKSSDSVKVFRFIPSDDPAQPYSAVAVPASNVKATLAHSVLGSTNKAIGEPSKTARTKNKSSGGINLSYFPLLGGMAGLAFLARDRHNSTTSKHKK